MKYLQYLLMQLFLMKVITVPDCFLIHPAAVSTACYSSLAQSVLHKWHTHWDNVDMQVLALSFSPEGSWVVTASKDGTWAVWNIDVRYALDEDPKVKILSSQTQN